MPRYHVRFSQDDQVVAVEVTASSERRARAKSERELQGAYQFLDCTRLKKGAPVRKVAAPPPDVTIITDGEHRDKGNSLAPVPAFTPTPRYSLGLTVDVLVAAGMPKPKEEQRATVVAPEKEVSSNDSN